MDIHTSIYNALQGFAATVKAKTTQVTAGEPEDQLRAPFEALMNGVAAVLDWHIVPTGETPLPDNLGQPDYAIHLNKLLAGYVELKAPGVGADAKRFKGHNREQFKRFSAIPNILYTDGNEWALYRSGKLLGKLVRLSGNVATDGKKAVTPDYAASVEHVLRDFLSWQPILPTDHKGKIDLRRFAELLAPLCRMLREDVKDALKDSTSPLVQLAKDWRQLLFPDASDEQFADAYAQTVTFAMLLGRSEGADPFTLANAENALSAQHSLLSRALQVLTDPSAKADMGVSIELLLRVIASVPPSTLSGPVDPWLYFYEDFLAIYDTKLRKDAGAYYTPVEVVHAQVRLIDDLLVKRLKKPLGFADPDVIILDPGVGTGTYLLGVIEHALGRIEADYGAGAVPGYATDLANNLYGFEIMVGPYSVSELRISRALRDRGATLPKEGPNVFLTDTLESPHAKPPQLPLWLKPISDQHAKALEVKSNVPVIVCLGNPPYDRHEAATADNKARAGGWVRWGDGKKDERTIFHDFLDPTLAAGHGVDAKNLYNLYVYFWRWALWKVFEQKTAQGPGVVSFISASSYIDGDAFCGMREHMRRLCDDIWVLDLGGEGRGTRKSENVFAIQTPVAITVALRSVKARKEKCALVHYGRIEGTRDDKLAALNAIDSFKKVTWQDCPDAWQAPFRPAGTGTYFVWPLLTDLMPWQHSGVELKRTWPIAPDAETLARRWSSLLLAKDKSQAFRETEDRKVNGTYDVGLVGSSDSTPVAKLPNSAPMPHAQRYAHRSLDRQYIIRDGRLMSRPRPVLWHAHGPKQVYLTSLFNHPLGDGPALTACAQIPDRHHLRGSYGGKDVLPLYRAADGSQVNITPGLLEVLAKTYDRPITPESFLAYVYGTLAQPAFTARYEKALETRKLHVPITKDGELFGKVSHIGAQLLFLHTYGERFVPKGKQPGQIPQGSTKCTKAVPADPDSYPQAFYYSEATRTLHVGDGEFAPVAPDVYEFEVSGLKVVQSWLKYRMKEGAGKKSSPLDNIHPEHWTSQFTTELLHLLWVLEATVAIYPEQASLLERLVTGDCFRSDELPEVPEWTRKPPKTGTQGGDLFDMDDDD
jgi:hypothetical protein